MDFDTSLQRILTSGHEFGERFYGIFFEQHPDAKPYFQGTDMKSQAIMLSVSLRLIGDFHQRGFSAIQQYLRMLGTRHAKRDVPREMYPKWRESLLTTLAEFHGADWSDQLAEEWRSAVDAIAVIMFEGYDKHANI